MLVNRSFGVAGLVFVAFVFLSVGLAVAQPDNDRFADAIEVFDLPFEDRADLGEAGIEPGERMESCGPIENTVWYAVTLPDTTLVSVDTRGSDHDTIVVVWTGSGLGDLQIVECNDDTPFGAEAAVEFFAEGGETYFVQVGSFGLVPSGISATLALSISEGPLGFDTISEGPLGFETGPFAVEEFPEFGDEFGLVAGELFLDEGGTVPAIAIGFLALWLALATWVYFDALERRRPPIAWAGAVFLLGWLLLIPLFLYLIFRDRPAGPGGDSRCSSPHVLLNRQLFVPCCCGDWSFRAHWGADPGSDRQFQWSRVSGSHGHLCRNDRNWSSYLAVSLAALQAPGR